MRPLCTSSSPAPSAHPQIHVSASVWGKTAELRTIGTPLKPNSCWRECVCDALKNGKTVVSFNRRAKTVFKRFFTNVCVIFYWTPPPLTSYALFCYSIHFSLEKKTHLQELLQRGIVMDWNRGNKRKKP